MTYPLISAEIGTMNDDGVDPNKKDKAQQGLVVIVGGCNSVNATTVIQINGDTLSAIAVSLQNLPSEAVDGLLGPIGEVLKAAGFAVSRANL
jgi:hypothetical protein